MIREIVIPTNNTYLLRLPDEYIGIPMEVIAFPIAETRPSNERQKRNMEDIKSFFKENAVDFTTIEKWNREDLYG